MKTLVILNGPNLNLLGKREPGIYGNVSFEDYFQELKKMYPDVKLLHFQTNSEQELIGLIQEHGYKSDGIILNPGAFTHTSIAIADAVAAVKCPVVEVHISNIAAREKFRQGSFITAKCTGSISGFGMEGYRLGVEALTGK